MTLSMYQASVPRFINILGNLNAILRHNGVEIGKRDYLGNP